MSSRRPRHSARRRHRHGLTCGHRGNDEVGLRGEIGVRRGQGDAMLACVIAQRLAGLIAAKLSVVSADLHVLLAQVLGEDAADFAVADKTYVPLPGVGCKGGHSGALSKSDIGLCEVLGRYCFGILAFSITCRHLSMSDLSRAEISSGVPALASMPSASSRFLSPASASISCKAPLGVFPISGGVRAGANSAFQEATS